MSGLTEQDLIDLDDWLASAPLRPLVDLLAQIRARAVAETAERIAVELLAFDPVVWALAGQGAGGVAARISRAEAGR